MESFQPLDADFNQDSFLNEKSRYYLAIGARWAKFIAIVQIILWSIYSFFFLMGIFQTTRRGGDFISIVMGMGLITGLWIMSIALLGFANRMQTAIKSEDRESYILAFKNLKTFFLVAGIFTIIFIVLFLIGLLFGLNSSYYY